MSTKITREELNTMIANVIREKNLNNIFGDESLEKIRKKVMNSLEAKNSNQIEENEEIKSNMEQNITPQASTALSDTAIQTPSVQPQHVVELPEFINKIEPGKIIIFNENELSHGAENLSRVPYRLMENPDQKVTIKDMWLKDGKKKAEVYIAKFEKIGEIEYNHMDGTSKFSNLSKIDTHEKSDYSNPYQEKSEIQKIEDKSIETYIKSAVDLESVIEQKVEDILAKYFQSKNYQSQEKVIPQTSSVYSNLDMNKIASGNEFTKIDTPEMVAEAFSGKNVREVSFVVEGSDFKVFNFNEKEFILPKNPISTRKCYTRIEE